VKLVLIHNPRSGRNHRRISPLPAWARAAGIPCWEITDSQELADAWPAIARERPDLLIVNGGDGTVDAVVTALRRAAPLTHEPMLALLPGGTTNMIARDVGLSGPPERAWRQILAALAAGAAGERISRPPLTVRTDPGAPEQWGFFLGGGALPGLLGRMQKKGRARGFIGRGREIFALVRTTGRLYFGGSRRDPELAPRCLRWTSGQKPEEEAPVILYFVTTLNQLVLGINPARPDPGLRLLALRHPYRHIVGSVARLLRGKSFDALGDDFIFREGRSLTLRCEDETVLDGEPVPAGTHPATLKLELGRPVTFWRI